jgi:selenocysteine lyase/cysteine desulfurase
MNSVEFRGEFPALARIAWFNTPGVPPAASTVHAAVSRALDAWCDGSFDWRDWEADAEATRLAFARLLKSEPQYVALMSSLADAAGTVAASLAASARRGQIVVPAREFRSNLFPWTQLRDHGFDVRLIEIETERSWTETVIRAITPGTTLVAISEVQSATGLRIHGQAVLAQCRKIGAELFLNMTQSLGVLEGREWLGEVDYVAAHGYKWLLAPRGAAWLYVRPDRLRSLRPRAPNWKSVERPYSELYGSAAYSSHASRLDASLAWLSWVGARASLELIESLDPRTTERHALSLAHGVRSVLERNGLAPVAEDAQTQIVSAIVRDADSLAFELGTAGVKASSRGGCIRFGCHYFNDQSDLDKLDHALAASVSLARALNTE